MGLVFSYVTKRIWLLQQLMCRKSVAKIIFSQHPPFLTQIKNMRPTIILMTILSVVATTSCKKRTDQRVEIPQLIDSVLLPPWESPEYMNAKPGNYWVYRTYKVNDNGSEEALNIYDTARAEKDTLINHRLYHKMLWPEFGGGIRTEYITDSADYIVTNFGKIIFSASDFGRVFDQRLFISPQLAPPPSDTIAQTTHQMGDRDLTINVPVGTFTTSAYIERYDFRPPHNNPAKTRSYYYRYAKGVGLVSYTRAFYLNTDHVYEARLVQYKAK